MLNWKLGSRKLSDEIIFLRCRKRNINDRLIEKYFKIFQTVTCSCPAKPLVCTSVQGVGGEKVITTRDSRTKDVASMNLHWYNGGCWGEHRWRYGESSCESRVPREGTPRGYRMFWSQTQTEDLIGKPLKKMYSPGERHCHTFWG